VGDLQDTAPAWATAFDRSHPYTLACFARRDDDSHDLPWAEPTADMDRCGRGLETERPGFVGDYDLNDALTRFSRLQAEHPDADHSRMFARVLAHECDRDRREPNDDITREAFGP